MVIKLRFLFLLLVLSTSGVYGQLQSPDEFLPHRIGEQFTPHHLLVDYMQHVAANSPNVRLVQYGMTNEKRPLLLMYISTPENLARLDEIRENNLRRTGMVEGAAEPALDRAIVWLSFSVHGNEASGSESSMPTVYALADPENRRTQAWLENTVVIVDPCINPDGYSRYTHWFRGNAHTTPNPNPDVYEHDEPWPGGRVNHYLFDLNRDWAWQTQVESHARLKMYHQWMPHVHADFHEMGYNSPYYFAPAARPYHEYITDWQVDFQKAVGKNHAKYFDEQGWLYFTGQVYDLLYPSYGDTWPTYNGAIGMTYEQAGGGGAGRAVLLNNGDTLTLEDRIMHHYTTALSTVEVSSNNAAELLYNFAQYYQKNRNDPQGAYRTFIIKGSNTPDKLKAFCTLLDKNKIQYGRAQGKPALETYNYQTGSTKRVTVEENDLVISAFQPKAVLVQALLDPNTYVEDSLTYDITAWSLPYAYGLEAYASKERVRVNPGYSFPAYRTMGSADTDVYAYLVRWEALQSSRFLSAVLQHDIKVRFATDNFRIEDKDYAPGTLIITKADNRKMGDRFHQLVTKLADDMEQAVEPVKTGLVQQGVDFGSRDVQFLQTPQVAVLAGEGTSTNNYGQIWYYFEQDIDYPFHAIAVGDLRSVDLSAYNVLVLPEGNYRLSDSDLSRISSWVSDGGRLIAVGSSVRKLEDRQGFALTRYASESAKNEAQRRADQERLDSRLLDYGGERRRSAVDFNPGSIVQLNLDKTHPLAFGLSDTYFSLKTNSLVYEPLKDAWNVGVVPKDPIIKGFMGYQLKKEVKRSVTFAVENKGRGAVIYMVDNPLFRSFWENGKLLFSNALFFAGQ